MAAGTSDKMLKAFTPPVIILGMHRSGTSLLTGCLEQAGVFLGEVNNAAPHNRKGNKENETLRALHDTMLASRGYDWKTPPGLPLDWSPEERDAVVEALQGYKGVPFWGFKDPRALWLLEGYLKLFPNAHLIGIYRNPNAVARSLQARPGALSLSEAASLQLWRQTNTRMLEIAARHRVTLLRFGPKGMADTMFFAPFQAFLQQVGLPSTEAEFYDPSLVNQFTKNDRPNPPERPIWRRLQALSKAVTEAPNAPAPGDCGPRPNAR